jgi:hypothetical protein
LPRTLSTLPLKLFCMTSDGRELQLVFRFFHYARWNEILVQNDGLLLGTGHDLHMHSITIEWYFDEPVSMYIAKFCGYKAADKKTFRMLQSILV